MALVFELIKRGYRVCISTHSSQVLDIIWAIQTFKEYDAQINDVLQLFELRKNDLTSELAEKALEAEIYVYYFKRDGRAEDISRLDPGSSHPEEYGWGGLTEFAAKVNDLVAEVVNRFERQNAHRDVEESV
jgi:hypothetical protein